MIIQTSHWWGHDTHVYDHVWRKVWRGRRPARVSKSRRRSEANSVRVPEVEAQSNSSSSLPRPLGLVCLKLVTQDASGLHFRRSIYGWKANLIKKPIQVVSRQKLFGINGNSGHKSASRICQDAATPYFGLLDRVSCLGPLEGASRGVMPKTL